MEARLHGWTEEPDYSCEELLVACVVADDGAPRCTDPLLVADEASCEEADDDHGGDWRVRHWDWQLAAAARAPDRLELDVRRGRPPRTHKLHGLPLVEGFATLGAAR